MKKNSLAYPSAEYMAELLLDELQITGLEDLHYLEEIASRRNALVVFEKLDGAEARIAIHRQRAVITVSSATINPARIRFSIAHELGHFEMHRYEGDFLMCQSQDLNNWLSRNKTRNLEAEANEFAAAFLLPKRYFEPLCLDTDPSLQAIYEFARLFRTSLTATALRYVYFSPEPCAVVFSENRKVVWVIPNSPFRDLGIYIESRVYLDESSLAQEALNRNKQRIAGRVALYSWADPGEHYHHATIQEESWVSSSKDAVLTLLWVDEEIYEGDNEIWV